MDVVELPITYRGTVYPWQCDHMAHMNVMWYVSKFDEATWHVFAHLGLTPSFLRQHDRGMAGVQQSISYKRELRAGDIVAIQSGILEMREKVIRFLHEMRNEETGGYQRSPSLPPFTWILERASRVRFQKRSSHAAVR